MSASDMTRPAAGFKFVTASDTVDLPVCRIYSTGLTASNIWALY